MRAKWYSFTVRKKPTLAQLAESLPGLSSYNCAILPVNISSWFDTTILIDLFFISQLVLNSHCHFQLWGNHLRLSVHYTNSDQMRSFELIWNFLGPSQPTWDHLTQTGAVSLHVRPPQTTQEKFIIWRQSPPGLLVVTHSCNNSDSTCLSYPHWLQE